ncbi:MAG: acyl transferase [Ginsengibacter sp.]
MNNKLQISNWENTIFTTSYYDFEKNALDLFKHQYNQIEIYQKYVDLIIKDISKVNQLNKIPFLPISFFKTHLVTDSPQKFETIFESSGTTGFTTSKHLVTNLDLYKKSFLKSFNLFYGDPKDYCILGLLPSYLENSSSSLVFMVEELIKRSINQHSGFYLDDLEVLFQTIAHNELTMQPTLLIGVTYALLDFAKAFPMKLKYTTVIETGGMKGRREEMTRADVHESIKQNLGVSNVHSEYGMTELLSQAYSSANGIFKCPPWMKVLIRENDDPFDVRQKTKGSTFSGLINIIDLANLHSCCFIATDDVGRLHKNGQFEIMGRRDNSDIRGCSLLTI